MLNANSLLVDSIASPRLAEQDPRKLGRDEFLAGKREMEE